MGDHPATKQDLAELRADVSALEERFLEALHTSEDRLREFVQGTEDRVREFVRDVETNLLKAFYSFAESDAQRHTLSEGQQANLLKRMGVLEERVLAVEKRLNMPPAA
jgi:hypothetical protein